MINDLMNTHMDFEEFRVHTKCYIGIFNAQVNFDKIGDVRDSEFGTNERIGILCGYKR